MGLLYLWTAGVQADKATVYQPTEIPSVFRMSEPSPIGESTQDVSKSIQKNSNLPIQDQIRVLEPEIADTLIALADCESDFRPDVRGVVDKRDRGLYQINSYWHPEVSDECAFSVACSTKFTADMIRDGQGWQWACWDLIKYNLNL
jgi:hypothetical protein